MDVIMTIVYFSKREHRQPIDSYSTNNNNNNRYRYQFKNLLLQTQSLAHPIFTERVRKEEEKCKTITNYFLVENREKIMSSKSKTNLVNFSFCNFKHSFESFLNGSSPQETLVEDRSDFWKFVAKYESILKSSGQPVIPSPVDSSIPLDKKFSEFQKRFYIPLDFNEDEGGNSKKLSKRFVDDRNLSTMQIKQFGEIVLIYLDFKQKEKFQKIKKLRKTQKSLPIYKFKEKIKECLEKEQILIIAGDTGCGKSTQVPQYLHEFGFQKIGEWFFYSYIVP